MANHVKQCQHLPNGCQQISKEWQLPSACQKQTHKPAMFDTLTFFLFCFQLVLFVDNFETFWQLFNLFDNCFIFSKTFRLFDNVLVIFGKLFDLFDNFFDMLATFVSTCLTACFDFFDNLFDMFEYFFSRVFHICLDLFFFKGQNSEDVFASQQSPAPPRPGYLMVP